METTTRTTGKERALNEFITAIGEIQAVLEDLKSAADDHFYTEPEKIHWGHVGDAHRVLDGLEAIAAIVRNEQK